MQKSTEFMLDRILFGVAFILKAVTLFSLPFAFTSILKGIRHPDHEAIPMTPPDLKTSDNYSRIEVSLHSVDEINHTVSFRVNGYHVCNTDCGYTDKIVFFEAHENDPNEQSLPPSATVPIPSHGAEISAEVKLPIRGSVLTYPFDKYQFGIGVVIERENADKTVRILTPEETKGHLIITLDEQLSRLEMTRMRNVEPKLIKPANAKFDYAYATLVDFERPAFLKIVVSIILLLTVAVAIYTMITRPFDQLVINAGAVILGVFGARSLVLSGFPSDVTLVDTVFSLVVLYNLLALTIRGMNFFHRAAKLKFLPWVRPEPEKPVEEKPEQKDCPECLSKVPVLATRCSFCTCILPTQSPT